MKVKIALDQWKVQSELTMKVDQAKFTEEMAREINEFRGMSKHRLQENGGDHVKTALRMIAAEAFFIVANNDMFDGEYIESKFEITEVSDGIEGFYSFKDMGIKITDIEVWHLDHDMAEITLMEGDVR